MADMSDEDKQMLYDYLSRQSVDPNAPQHDLLSQFPQLAQAPVTPAGNFDYSAATPVQEDEGPGPNEETAPAAAPTAPAQAPITATPAKLPQSINDVVGPKYTDDARAQLYQQLQTRNPMAILGTALSGVGDAVANSYGTGGAHHEQDTQNLVDAKRNAALQEFERGRTEQIQNFDQNVKLAGAQRDAQKYQLDQQQLVQNRDPNSDVSQAKRQLLSKYTGQSADSYAGLTGEQIDRLLPTTEKAYQADTRSKEIQALHSMSIGTKESQQQDKLETQARQSLTSLRGDKSLQNTETQRDAAITAYNRINEIQQQGQALNPIDYVDILGQIYKARTGSAPTNEVLQSARQATAKGDLAKAYTYFTGQQAPATTQNIMDSLKTMAASMGRQADQLHDAYMKTHLMKPSGLEDSRWQPIAQTGRGMSFAEATGATPQAQGAPQGGAPQVAPGEVARVTKDGKTAIFDANTKQFKRWG